MAYINGKNILFSPNVNVLENPEALEAIKGAIAAKGGTISAAAGYDEVAPAIYGLPVGDPLYLTVEDSEAKSPKQILSGAQKIAIVEKIGGMTYRDGATLKDAKVTAIKSVGANLIPFPYVDDKETINGITYEVNADGTVNVSGTATGTAYFTLYGGYAFEKCLIPKWLKVGKKYTTSTGNAYVSLQVYLYPADGGSGKSLSGTFTMPDGYAYCGIFLCVNSGITVNAKLNPMVNYGDTALPYALYKEYPTLQIPAAVQSLEGYGRGVSEEYCNRIEWKPDEGLKKFVVKTKVQTFNGSEYWFFTGEGNARRVMTDYNSGFMAASKEAVCNRYEYGKTESNVGTFDVAFNVNTPYLRFNVANLNINTVDEWKALLAQWHAEGNPLTVVYGVSETQETDISDIITDDMLVEISGGGSVEFVNEAGGDVPNAITYLRRVE